MTRREELGEPRLYAQPHDRNTGEWWKIEIWDTYAIVTAEHEDGAVVELERSSAGARFDLTALPQGIREEFRFWERELRRPSPEIERDEEDDRPRCTPEEIAAIAPRSKVGRRKVVGWV